MVSVPCDGSGSGLVAGLAVYIESVCVQTSRGLLDNFTSASGF